MDLNENVYKVLIDSLLRGQCLGRISYDHGVCPWVGLSLNCVGWLQGHPWGPGRPFRGRVV